MAAPHGIADGSTQLYAIGMTALWFYEYLLTLDDEVAGLHNDDDTEKYLTALYRSVMHGKWRALLVSGPLAVFAWGALKTFQCSHFFYS